MSGLRVCMLTTFYPPYNFGGDGIGVQRLSRALARRGHRVTVVHDADAYNLLSPTADPPPLPEPVLVMRQVTERNEAVAAGTARPVGTDTANIVSAVAEVLKNKAIHLQMAAAHSPYGDGRAAERIVGHIAEVFGLHTSPTPTARRNRIPVDLV